MKQTYKVYEDAGHSWMEVLKSELIDLGINKSISAYSYQNDEYAYLEEDCDAGKFIDAKKRICIEIEGDFIYAGDSSPIRDFEKYEGV